MNPQQQNDPTEQNPPAEAPYGGQGGPLPTQNQQPYQPQQMAGQAGQQPQVVYMARPMEPSRQNLSPEAQQKHEESVQKYPNLNLSKGEYVIFAIKRHPIGLVYIWTCVILVVLAMLALAGLFTSGTLNDALGMSNYSTPSISPAVVFIPVALIALLAFLFGFIAAYVYSSNRFYLTNESVIQHIQTSLFRKHEQTISLGNIEDASYYQDGILEYMLGYGQIRLSTQGDETTYRFHYASKPQQQIAILNNAVEDFKNIRPVGD